MQGHVKNSKLRKNIKRIKNAKIRDKEEYFKKETENIKLRVNKVNDTKKELEPYNNKVKENKEKIAELTEKCNPLESKKKEIEYNLKDIQKKNSNLDHENQKMQMTMNQLLNQKKEFEEKIEDEKKKIENINNNERERQEIKIQELNHSISELIKKKDEIKIDLENNNNEINQSKKDEELLKDELQTLDDEIHSLNQNINRLNSQKKDRVKAFHDRYPDILRTVEEYDRQGRWENGKPVGPFGMYIVIKNEYKEWSNIIETLLKNIVSAMGVFSHNDRKLMQSILTKYNCNAAVYVCRKEKIDFSKGEPEEKYLTVLRAIECNNEVAIQQLIVNTRIEQILLIKNRKEADIVMSTGPNNGFPINVAACYTIEGFQVGSKGGYATISINLYKGPPKLLNDVDEVIKENQLRINELIINEKQKKDEIQKCIKSYSFLQAQKQKMRNQLEGIQREINYKQSQKMQIQEEMEDKTPEDISTIEKKLSAVINQVDILKKQRSELQEQINTIKSEEYRLKTEINKMDDYLNLHNEEIEKLKNEISNEGIIKKIQDLNEKLQHYSSEMQSHYQRNKELEKEIEEMKITLEDNTKLASQYCKRVRVEKSKSDIEKELKAIQQQQQIHKHFDPHIINTLLEKYREMTEEYKKAKSEIAKYDTFVKKLKESVNIRMKRWYEFRIFICLRAKNIFSELLSRRGYKGSIIFSHRKRQLNLKVQIEDQALVNASGNETYEKDPKALSGGEKSFSTICLLLSLWETMGCPIRGLDEFDVFMDAVNRRISMKMLIESARDTAQTQYILITPQDMSNIQEFGLDSLRIIRMEDPERKRAYIS